MIKQNLTLIFIIIISITISACSQGPRPLEAVIKKNNLCVFTNNPKTYASFDNSVLVYLGKIDYTKEFKSTYKKLYTKAPLPIEETNCVAIPLEVIDKNVPYEIVLETNKSFHARICIIDKGNRLEVKHIEAGKSACN